VLNNIRLSTSKEGCFVTEEQSSESGDDHCIVAKSNFSKPKRPHAVRVVNRKDSYTGVNSRSEIVVSKELPLTRGQPSHTVVSSNEIVSSNQNHIHNSNRQKPEVPRRYAKLGNEDARPVKHHQCDNSLIQESDVKKHQTTHSKVKIYWCRPCKVSFKKKKCLNEHRKTHESFKCSKCSKSFVSYDYLSNHVKNKHSLRYMYRSGIFSKDNKSTVIKEMPYKVVSEDSTYTSDEGSDTRAEVTLSSRLTNDPPDHMVNPNETVVGGEYSTYNSVSTEPEGVLKKNEDRPFECNECNKCFKLKHHLKRHLITHTEKKDFKCDKCGMPFNMKCNLVNHVNSIHVGYKGKRWGCPQCPKRYSYKGQLRTHLRVHAGAKPFACGSCTMRFSIKSSLIRHELTHVPKGYFSCDQCDKSYSRITHLATHKLTHGVRKRFKCNVCSIAFFTRASLEIHLLLHSDSPVTKLSCNMCYKIFKDNIKLEKHMERHANNEFVECVICKKKFDCQQYLNVHMKRHRQPVYNCEFCTDVSFKFKSMLTEHISTEHVKMRSFQCDRCNLAFFNKSLLSNHIKTHKVPLKPKIYKCRKCKYTFFSKSDRSEHIKDKHKDDRFLCVVCNSSFKNRSSLTIHTHRKHKLNKSYECNKCDQIFTQQNLLQDHIDQCHYDKFIEGKFACNKCPQSFVTEHLLNNHRWKVHFNNWV